MESNMKIADKSPMNSLSLMKDTKFPDCGRITGYTHLTRR
jgi:hypothetical protein